MSFPEQVTVGLTLFKIGEETIDGATWITYALRGAPALQLDFQIEAGSFDEQDLKDLEAALAEDLAEAIVGAVRAAQAGGVPN